ncbi:unnamed protein product, partial [Effrenium voratum]
LTHISLRMSHIELRMDASWGFSDRVRHMTQASSFEEVSFENEVWEGSVVAKVVNWSTLCSLAEEVSLME